MIVCRVIRLYKKVYGQNTHYMYVCGLVCYQHVCAARCAARRRVLLENMVFLVFLVKVVTFWMILERILSPCFEEM